MSKFCPRNQTLFRIVGILLALTAVAIVGCSNDSTTAPDDDGGTPPPRELTINLDATSATPGVLIKINGIPDDVDFAYAVVTTAGAPVSATAGAGAQADSGAAHIYRTETGDELLVPLHPTAPMQGGMVNIEVTNGSNVTSNRVKLDVDPLPEAPGAFDALVTKLESLLAGWIDQAGTTAEEMRSKSADQLSPVELSMYLLHVAINHPDNPNSLRAFADGDIPLAEGAEIDRDVLDGLAAQSGLAEFLDDKISFVDTLTAPAASVRFARHAAARAPGQLDCFDGPTFDIEPDNCYKLAEVMSYQAQLRLEKASAVEKLKDDAIKTVASALGYAGGAMLAWGITNTLWAADNIQSGSIGVYPSSFLSERTDFVADPEVFPEDFTSAGEWSEFRVTAVSDGWQFDKVLKDALKKALKLRKSGWDSDANAFFDKAMKKTYRDYEKNIEKNAKNAVYNQVKNELNIDELTKLEYCTQIWEDIDCTGLPYSRGSSPELDVDSGALTYEPSAVGATTLEVETAEAFGFVTPTGETKGIETRQIEVFVDPFQAQAGTNEWVTFRARVENAEDESVDWYTEGTLPADLQIGPDSARVLTPSDPWAPAILVKARSRAKTGLRKDVVNTDPREGSAPLTYGDALVVVTPTGICLKPLETQTFAANVLGIEDQSVTWSTDPPNTGTFNGSTYTAPNSKVGTVVIIATSDAVPSAKGYAAVRVAGCECWWTAVVSGGRTFYWTGTNAAWSDDLPGTTSFTLESQVEGPGIHYPVITGFVSAEVTPDGTGTWRFIGTVELDATTLWNPGDPDSDEVPELTVVSNDGETIEGFIEGPFFRPLPGGDPIQFETIRLSAHFKATDGALGICQD